MFVRKIFTHLQKHIINPHVLSFYSVFARASIYKKSFFFEENLDCSYLLVTRLALALWRWSMIGPEAWRYIAWCLWSFTLVAIAVRKVLHISVPVTGRLWMDLPINYQYPFRSWYTCLANIGPSEGTFHSVFELLWITTPSFYDSGPVSEFQMSPLIHTKCVALW